MDRLTREILEKIAKEVGKPPDDPQVVQVVYKMVWEIATGQKPADVKREPNPLLPPKEDPAIRPPDAQDLTDLVDSILEDPAPRTEFLAKPQDVGVEAASTGMWLKSLLNGLKEEPKDSARRRELKEWVPAPKGGAAPDDTDKFRSGGPSPELAALVGATLDAGTEPPAPQPQSRVATVVYTERGAPVAARPSGPRFVRRGVRSESPGEQLTAEEAAKSAPAWLAAAAVHLVVAVVLMNIVYFTSFRRSNDVFRLTLASAPPLRPPPDRVPELPGGTQEHGVVGHHDEDSPPAGPEDPLDPQPAGVRLPEIPVDVRAPAISLGNLPDAPGTGTSGHEGLGGFFAGRGGSKKQDALKANGGDEDTEAAVRRGLKWLAAHQSADGSWGAETQRVTCGTDFGCGFMQCGYPVATTGLALLAFVGAGHTHFDGDENPYAKTVKRAAEFLCSRQTQDGVFEEAQQTPNYTHAIATSALSELLGMTQDPRLRLVCERALGFIVSGQQENGGWDYDTPRTGRGDVSVTGWMIMALRSARAAGLNVPSSTWSAARKFYQLATDEKKPWAAYFVMNKDRNGGTPAIQAAAVLARNYLGLPRGGLLETKTIELLSATPPCVATPPSGQASDWHRTYYYTYYATLVMFYNGGEEWLRWNKALKRELLPMQYKSGHEDGSWPPKGVDSERGGRIYSTAMAILNLEVYYRYLPSYKAEVDLLTPLDTATPNSVASRVRPETPSGDLIEFLRRGDTTVRRAASRELCRRKEEGALDALLSTIKTESATLRSLMIEDLAAFGDNDRVLKALVDMLEDESTRNSALRALRKATGLTGDTPQAWRDWWAGRKK